MSYDIVDVLREAAGDYSMWDKHMAYDTIEEIRLLRAELVEAQKPDCRLCLFISEHKPKCTRQISPCDGGSGFMPFHEPIHLYQIDAALAAKGE